MDDLRELWSRITCADDGPLVYQSLKGWYGIRECCLLANVTYQYIFEPFQPLYFY